MDYGGSDNGPWAVVFGSFGYPRYYRAGSVQGNPPPDIVKAVVMIESDYNPKTLGRVGEIGLMQVRPETAAAMLGFRGSTADLAEPEVNIRFGATYLSQAWRLSLDDLWRTMMKYRAGHGEEVVNSLSAAYPGSQPSRIPASPFASAEAATLRSSTPSDKAKPAVTLPPSKTVYGWSGQPMKAYSCYHGGN